MGLEKAVFNLKGMARDTADAKSSNELAFENHNIRFTPTDDNTLLVITNEKGTSPITHTPRTHTVSGTIYNEVDRVILGYAVIYNTIVLFEKVTFSASGLPTTITLDFITKIEKGTTGFDETDLYKGDLNFDVSNPIETLPLYESENIQKVYWVDGINQPRVVNIKNIKGSGSTPKTGNDGQFDFLPPTTFNDTLTITRQSSPVGSFPGGTLQYGFTYSNKNGQETKIINISTLQYTTFDDRAASPDETTTHSYKVTITNVDTSFDYINVYSVMRTSENGEVVAKLVERRDINHESGASQTYDIVDTNTNGETLGSTDLLYKGGEAFVAYTIASKDNTLFLGNLTYNRKRVDDTLKNAITSGITVSESRATTIQNWYKQTGFYPKRNILLDPQTTYFKAGNKYRIGVQLQDNRGVWSEPIWINDHTFTIRPKIVGSSTPGIVDLELPLDYLSLSSNLRALLVASNYKRIRPLVVLPNEWERGVIAQGIVCPTVFNPNDRNSNLPFAQSSWFFRPYNKYGYDFNYNSSAKHSFEARAFSSLPPANCENSEVAYSTVASCIINNSQTSETTPITGYDFFIDPSILTFHSPDITSSTLDSSIVGAGLKIVGAFAINSLAGRLTFEADRGAVSAFTYAGKLEASYFNITRYLQQTYGWIKNVLSEARVWIEYIVISQQLYSVTFSVNPWNSPTLASVYTLDSGIVNVNLIKKIYSNIRISQDFDYYPIDPNQNFSLKDIKIYRKENYGSFVGLQPLDNLATTHSFSKLYYSGGGTKSIFPGNYRLIVRPTDYNRNTGMDKSNLGVVNINYKGDSHAVLVLNNTNNNELKQLPTPYSNLAIPAVGHPYWMNSTSASTEYYKIFDTRELQEFTPFVTPSIRDFYRKGVHWQFYKATDSSTLPEDPGTAYNTGHIMVERPDGNFELWIFDRESVGTGHSSWRREYPVSSSFNMFYISTDSTSGFSHRGYVKVHPIDPTNNTAWKWGFDETYTPSSQSTLTLPDGITGNNGEEIMWITELTRPIPANIFGGNSQYAIEHNQWIPCGEATTITPNLSGIKITEGDTVFNRWDCLKTMPYATDDLNQVVEIMSFMCESYINTGGRYDKNQGLEDYTFLNESTPFNQFNDVYNNRDNYFNYRISEINTHSEFPSRITWSLSKTLGEDLDTWSNISLGSILDLDGDKGKVRAIRRFKNSLYTFQDKGIADIIYNPSAAIASSSGVPIEIANSGKVEGKRYISENAGCTNKWSICMTPTGMYFVDNISKKLYQWSDQSMTCLSDTGGMSVWLNNIIDNNSDWTPTSLGDIITHYDRATKDVYFITHNQCLAYNERLGTFTSFYSYEDTPWIINLNNDCLAVHSESEEHSLHTLHTGSYNQFFGSPEDYSIEVIANAKPNTDKMFTNIEFIADSWANPGELNEELLPATFNRIRVYNEYQDTGDVNLTGSTLLRRKFRIWRYQIPRNLTNKWGSQSSDYTKDRIRNPWVHIVLKKTNDSSNTEKTVLSELGYTYFI